MLDKEQIDSFNENGFLRIPQVFTAEETDELADTLDQLMDDWANTTPGWRGVQGVQGNDRLHSCGRHAPKL